MPWALCLWNWLEIWLQRKAIHGGVCLCLEAPPQAAQGEGNRQGKLQAARCCRPLCAVGARPWRSCTLRRAYQGWAAKPRLPAASLWRPPLANLNIVPTAKENNVSRAQIYRCPTGKKEDLETQRPSINHEHNNDLTYRRQ